MPDKMTYQERKRKVHAELQSNNMTYVAITASSYVIAAQTEAIREFSKQMWEDKYTSDGIRSENTLDHITDMFLLDHGYIEPKTEDDGGKNQ